MARRASTKATDLSNGLAIARDSLNNIRRVSEDSLFGTYEIDPDKAFRLSYLREQFRFNEDLGALFDRYTDRINQAYVSLFLLLQIFLSVVHFVLVLILNVECQTLSAVILDLSLYGTISVTSLLALFLNEIFAQRRTKLLKLMSFIVFGIVFVTDLAVPLYHYFTELSLNLRPAYTVHIILACYLFWNVEHHLMAFVLAFIVTCCHLLTLGFVTYSEPTGRYFWEKLGSDLIFLSCLNALGVYFRLANELVKRRTFLDHRACVESTLKLKDEKEQEEQLMISIIPEHTAKEVRSDILKKIEHIEKLFKLPSTDPMDIPYVHEFDNVTILYADIVNYTVMTSKLEVVTLVETLNDLFGGFDDASEELNVLRIKFLGDCYYCVAGLPPNPAPNHAEACIDLGLRMISIIRSVREKRGLEIDMRIGVHSGRILSGLIGSAKWQFDIWSQDVHLANKMESSGEPGKVHLTKETLDLVKKSYNITPTNKGAADSSLIPYNVRTFLISPFDVLDDHTTSPESNTLPKLTEKKRLSMIMDVNEDEPNNSHLGNEKNEANGLVRNGLVRSTSEPVFSQDAKSDANEHDGSAGAHYERRESLRPSTVARRRLSGQSTTLLTTKRISARRNTPRRTAFMENNINRYHKRLQKTDECMKTAIENMPLTKYQQWSTTDVINPILLSFRNCKMEWEFLKLPDPLFKFYLICYMVLFIITVLIQNLTLPQWDAAWVNYITLIFLAVILISLTWMHSLWNQHFANFEEDPTPNNAFLRYVYTISKAITAQIALRTFIYLLVLGLFILCVAYQMLECEHEQKENRLREVKFVVNILLNVEPSEHCIIPWHMNYTFSLAVLTGFCFLRIQIGLKLLVALAISIFYSVTVWNFNREFYKESETFNYQMPPQVAHVISVIFLTITLHVIDRQTEYLSRLDYQWNQKLVDEKMEVNVMRKITKMLLKNILPIHVAELYLDVNRKSNVIYNESYKNVAVIFATVVDPPTDLSEKQFLGFMNRIIKDFDNLLPIERKKPIEKIKVNNLTYMAACGLDPGRRDSVLDGSSERSAENVVSTMVKFAVDMMNALKKIGDETQHQCKLRIGIDSGHVMAGVVGSKKPFYDIWGNTVNLASRMDSTGEAGKIQLTEAAAKILENSGITCDLRGPTFVKGKGVIPTYFVRTVEDDDWVRLHSVYS